MYVMYVHTYIYMYVCTYVIMIINTHTLHSYSHSVVGSMSRKMTASASTAVGMTDYGFLYSGGSMNTMSTMRVRSRLSATGEGEEEAKKPSIDDFDCEIAIFKVSNTYIRGVQLKYVLA